MKEIQDRRAEKNVPGARPVHDYVNLFFDARNSMMYKRRAANAATELLVVVRVDPRVIDLDAVVVTDGNVANHATRFYQPAAGIAALDDGRVYAQSWVHPDLWEMNERKRQRSAEVLVPDVVPVEYLLGCYVRSRSSASHCQTLAPDWPVEVNDRVFFDDVSH